MPAASIGVDFVANTARWTADIERAKGVLSSNEKQMNGSLSRISGGFDRMGKSSGAMRSGFQQLSFQINDVAAQMANGTKASVIFAQQSGQVIQALQLMSGGSSKFASFMGGPWGIAISVGVSALSALWSMHQQTEEAAKKNKDAHELFADKLDRTKHSLEEVTQAVRDYNGQQALSREITLQNAEAATIAAAKNIGEALSIRQKLAARLAEAQEASSRSTMGSAAGVYSAASNLSQVQQEIAANDAQLRSLAADARATVVTVAEQLAKIRSDPTEKTRTGFDLLRQNARRTITDVNALATRLADLNKQETAALARIAEANRGTKDRQSGREIDMAGARAIVAGIGGRVTSGVRSTSEQAVLYARYQAGTGSLAAPPGHSDHEAGRALDIAKTPGISLAKIRKAFDDAGVRIKQLLDEGNHFHVAWGGAKNTAEAAAAKMERAREKAVRRQEGFDSASAALDLEILAAKKAGVTDAGQLAQLARDQIKIEADKFNSSVEAKVKLGDLTRVQANELEIKNAIVASLKDQQIATEEATRKARETLDVKLAANDNERDLLSLQESLAVTTGQRRDLQLRMLEIEKETERLKLEETIASRTATDAQKRIAQSRLNQLDQTYSLKGEAVRNQTAGPLEQYLKDTDPAKLQERAETLVVNELESVHQGITDAIAGALGIQDPLLKGLIDMFIEQVLIRPIAQALQQAQGAGGGGGGGGWFGQLLGIGLGAIGGGGGTIGGLTASQFTGQIGTEISGWATPANILGGFASGTDSARPGYHWVGEDGPELLKFRGGEKVVPNHMLRGGNDNSGGTYAIHVNGAGMTDRQARETGAQIQRGIRQEQARNLRMGG